MSFRDGVAHVDSADEDALGLICHTLAGQARTAGVKYVAVHEVTGGATVDFFLSLDEAFAADGLLPMLVSIAHYRSGSRLSPLCLLPDRANTLTGWRVGIEEAAGKEPVKDALAFLSEELDALMSASSEKEVISLDSQMWQRLFWGDQGGTAVTDGLKGRV